MVAGGILGIAYLLSLFDDTPRTPDQPVKQASASPPDPYGGCLLRGLDNQSLNFARIVKQGLRNPASFEHVHTDAGVVKDGVFPVSMTYRATNGFGAVDTAVAGGEVRASDCAAKVLTTE